MSEFLPQETTSKVLKLISELGETHEITLRANGSNIADMTKVTVSVPRAEPVTHFTFAIPSPPDKNGRRFMSYYSVDVAYGAHSLRAYVVDYGQAHESRTTGLLGFIKSVFFGDCAGDYAPRNFETPRPYDPLYTILSQSPPLKNEFANALINDHIDAISDEIERIRTSQSELARIREAARTNTKEAKQDKVKDTERERTRESARERLKSAERTRSREADRFTAKEAERRSAKAAERGGNSGSDKGRSKGGHRGGGR